MATICKTRKQYKKSFRLQFRHPYYGWKQQLFDTLKEAEDQLATWNYIEMLQKTGQKFDHLLEKMGQIHTVGLILRKYEKSKLSSMKNKKTILRYKNVIKNIIEVYGENQPIKTLRTGTYSGFPGWSYYKHIMHTKGRVNRGINSDLNMAKIMFTYAFECDWIDHVVVKKVDMFTENEMEEVKFKEWKQDEIQALFTHTELSEYQKDLIHVYTMLGVRAGEILGKNKDCPDKTLQWEHVDFENSFLYISPKKVKGRRKIYMPPSVKVIFEKWQEYPMPLDFTYAKLHKDIISISNITGIKFTCHDLRRLHAQIVERHTGDMHKVATSIGDKSVDVAERHYAGVSMQTQKDIANDYANGLNSILSVS